jgi:hypothetical protein
MMMNNAVTAPAFSPTGTSATTEHECVLGTAGSQLITARSTIPRCIKTPDICPSTASVQPSTLDGREASIYVQCVCSALMCVFRTDVCAQCAGADIAHISSGCLADENSPARESSPNCPIRA